jgi:GNAT superfamily N-acetyltransferase
LRTADPKQARYPAIVELERLRTLPDDFARLAQPAAQEGFAFLERVRAEWIGGANRFDDPGEALFAARVRGELAGLCGLNVDPWAGDPSVGRLRNLYVHPAARGAGVGAALVLRVLERAAQRFRLLRLRAANAGLDRYYRAFGFAPTQDAHATHALALPDDEVELAPLLPRDDLATLARWFAADHVTRWWSEGECALAEARAPGAMEQAWIRWRARAVGYVRWRHPTRAELDRAGLIEVPTSVLDADLLIGEPDALGRGVGPRALRRLCARLAQRADATALSLCTSVDNVAAARAFVSAGFTRRRRFSDEDGTPTWLFLRELGRTRP